MDTSDERATATAAGPAAETADVEAGAPPAAGPPSPPGPPGAVARAAWLWWVYLVLAARRFSEGLATALGDGLYLVAWPALAFLLPPAAALLGLALGATHPGYTTSVTESLPLLLLLVALGTLTGHLGLAFLTGYVLGDVFVFNLDRLVALPAAVLQVLGAGDPPAAAVGLVAELGRYWLPLVILYGAMALPLFTFPVLVKTLLRSMSVLAVLGPWVSFAAVAAIHAGLTFALVYFWTQSAPLLIRPLFIWRGQSMTLEAVAPLQGQALTIATAALLASLVRVGLQGLTTFARRLRVAIDPAMARLAAAPPLTPLAERGPRLLAVLGRALTTTLLLAGLYMSWGDWGVLFGLVVLLDAARVGPLPLPLGLWAELVLRLPVVVRVAGTVAVLLVLANALAPLVQGAETFRPMILLTGVSLTVSFLFNPVSPLAPRARPEVAR